jgi:hypothetical protein
MLVNYTPIERGEPARPEVVPKNSIRLVALGDLLTSGQSGKIRVIPHQLFATLTVAIRVLTADPSSLRSSG